jgi:hypothetical protein
MSGTTNIRELPSRLSGAHPRLSLLHDPVVLCHARLGLSTPSSRNQLLSGEPGQAIPSGPMATWMACQISSHGVHVALTSLRTGVDKHRNFTHIDWQPNHAATADIAEVLGRALQ